ncbi:MAG: SUMF1/EgtB/PvdO family nonheme iron enzyme [Pseudomonadota bacterium]
MMQNARDKIRELRALHDDGLLSLEQFELRKNAILDVEYAPRVATPGVATPDADGSDAAPPARPVGTELGLMAGQEIGPQNRRYRLERLIALGGMGQVWQATDLATHAELGNSEMVALKILPPQLTQNATHAKLLIEEATQARKLAHEHIVRVYEWAQDPATASYFIIMEYLEGQDLDHYLAVHGQLALERVHALLDPVAEALSYAWEKHKLVHRDIKPANVFLTTKGEIKLLDFGIASRVRNAASNLDLHTPNAGTLGYRAPESGVHQRQPRPQVDVYGVAVMIYQMLEGTLPFGEGRQPGHLPSAPTALNAAQWQVLQDGFSLTAELRPASVLALLEALQRATGPTPEAIAAQAAAQAQAVEAERRQAEQQRQAQADEAEQAGRREAERQAQLARQRQAEAQAAMLEKLRLDKLRKEQEAQRRVEAEVARKARAETLRAQLRQRREDDAAQALLALQEQQRKAAQAKAETAYKAEQERARRQLAAHAAAELAEQMPTPTSPVADADGVLRDHFRDGSGKGPDLVLIPTGRFQMGGPEHEHRSAVAAGAQKSWLERETPQHWVDIAHSFALGRYPVTLGQWRQFASATGWQTQSDTDWAKPGFVQSDQHPVVGVSWNDAQLYVRWLSAQTGQSYRLPSEAEWEYACRAGSKTAFSCGDTISTELANYDGHYTYAGSARGSYRGGTSACGAFPANPWGLHDMHGNVWEWVQDPVHDNYQGAPTDGSVWQEGGEPGRRILRGGCWLYAPRYLRSALRNGFSAVLSNDIVGFRVARRLA